MAGDDERGGSVVERWVMTKFTLSFVAVVSFFSFLYSYFSGLWSYNIQFSTLIFSLFAHSVDRKYMFLICNGIVAFLVKNLTFGSSSSSSSSSGVIKSAEDGVKHLGEVLVQENVAEYVEEEKTEKQQQEMKVQDEDKDKDKDKVEENIVEEKVMEVEEKLEDESEEEEDEEEEVEVEENKGREEEVISDASVSTEELNHKFEEFIRKMKEEIRIEAQQQQQLVAAS